MAGQLAGFLAQVFETVSGTWAYWRGTPELAVPQAVKKRTALSDLHTAHPDESPRFMEGSVPKVLAILLNHER